MGQLGFPELLVIGIIVLLLFGPKKLPELGSGLGRTIRDFKKAMSDGEEEPKQPAQKQAEIPAAVNKSEKE